MKGIKIVLLAGLDSSILLLVLLAPSFQTLNPVWFKDFGGGKGKEKEKM